jgi:cytochrome b pre-mRNA-processing protein 3
MLLDWMRRGRARREAAHALYREIVRQARTPALYASFGAPDTLDGRFDLIVLHAYLVLRRLRRQGGAAHGLSQALFDAMFADMDRSLREIGVGDHSIAKRMRDMVQAFYGRIAAYDRGFATADGLEAALLRNVFRDAEEERDRAARLAGYVRRQSVELEAQPLAALLAGELRFAAAEVR